MHSARLTLTLTRLGRSLYGWTISDAGRNHVASGPFVTSRAEALAGGQAALLLLTGQTSLLAELVPPAPAIEQKRMW